MRNVEIEKWAVPDWHPDCGDADNELRMLTEFSLRLLASDDRLRVGLDCFEEGYMKVDIYRDGHKYAELYIVSRDLKPMYGLFVLGRGEEEEYYFDSIGDGIGRLVAK